MNHKQSRNWKVYKTHTIEENIWDIIIYIIYKIYVIIVKCGLSDANNGCVQQRKPIRTLIDSLTWLVLTFRSLLDLSLEINQNKESLSGFLCWTQSMLVLIIISFYLKYIFSKNWHNSWRNGF